MTKQEYVQWVVEAADSYRRTIEAIICLRGALLHHPDGYPDGVHYLPGRRMVRSDGRPVTPDVVVQVPDQVGLVGEVKLTASTATDWRRAEAQLHRYDCPLRGWVPVAGGTAPPDHDLLLLIDYVHKHAAAEHVQAAAAFERPLIVVSVTQSTTLLDRVWMAYERVLGDFRSPMLGSKLRHVESVALEHFTGDLSAPYFCDAAPLCTEYTMEKVWLVASQVTDGEREVLVGERRRPQRRVTVRRTCHLFREAYSMPAYPPGISQGQPTPPDSAWVRRALEAFVRIGWAQVADEPGAYWLDQKQPRGNLLATLAMRMYRHGGGRPVPQQLPLPGLE